MRKKIKICTIIGARPQFIKAAPVSHEFIQSGIIEEVSIHTGQHYDTNMSSIFFEELNMIKPKYNLNVGSASHAIQTAKIMVSLEETLDIEKPDGVLIYGDTNSTLAGAIVASKLHIPIIHVEAGLRSYNMKMPEEINRIIADSVSQLLLAPTDNAKKTLLNEGKNPDNVVVTGDVMYDVALKVSQKISFEQVLQNSFLEKNNYCVVTIHRAENTDSEERLYQIILLLEKISEKYHIIIPLHPRTKQALINLKLYDRLSANGKFSIINPLGYNDMAALMKYSCFIVSDSGGVQKEAFFHGKTCFILRNETEWVELVDSNWNVLLDNQDVNNSFNQIINYDETKREKINPYGQGDAAKIILSSILNYFQ